MSKAWIETVGDDALAFVHGISGSDLDTLATYAREKGDAHKSGGDMKHAMTVDQAVMIDWCNKRGVEFKELMRDQDLLTRFLNDPDNGVFRVWKGRV